MAIFRKQKGSSLIVCMVFLLLLTILGVSSMQSATMQEKMAGNAIEENRAFQLAEAGLRAGEANVQANSATLTSVTAYTLPVRGALPSGGGWSTSTVNGKTVYFHIQRVATASSVFRVAAIGYGVDPTSRVVLLSTFRPI